MEKKSGETQIIQDNLRDKDRRLEAALQITLHEHSFWSAVLDEAVLQPALRLK